MSSLIKNEKYPKNFDRFLQYMGLEYDPINGTLFEAHPENKELWAIWMRGPINTCTNSIESRHGHLNSQIRGGNLSIENRIRKLISYIINSYVEFDKNTVMNLYFQKYDLIKKAFFMMQIYDANLFALK